METDGIGELVKRSLRRVSKSNFQHLEVLPSEQELLSERGVKDEFAQRYAAWRRAILLLGAAAMVFWFVVEIATFESTEDRLRRTTLESAEKQHGSLDMFQQQMVEQQLDQQVRMLGEDNLGIMDGVSWIVTFAILVGAVFMVLAARSWADVRKSRRWARYAFFVVFLTPFAIAAIPFTAFMDFSHLGANETSMVTMLLGSTLGGKIFLLVAPRALTLFPASIRSSMTLKTMIPESPLPGWVTALFAPTYPGFLILGVALVNQMQGDYKLLLGLICLVIAPLVYLRRGREILRPHTTDEVDTIVASARKQALVFNLIGGALIGMAVLDLEFFSAGDAARFAASFGGNFLLVTVFASDLMLALMYISHRQSDEYSESDFLKEASRKFAGLTECGFTDLQVSDAAKSD
ncbi:MAG: hypothetical protein AAGD14_02445 [Planctomycetota bacterium]